MPDHSKLEDDVKGVIAFSLNQIRAGLLATSASATPTQLVDQAIAKTLSVCETHFNLSTRLVVDETGCPINVTGLVDEYWAMVNDNGDEPDYSLHDLRKTWNTVDESSSPE